MTEKEINKLAKEYCMFFRGQERAELLRKCLKTKNDFKKIICESIDWEKFKKIKEDNKFEFRVCCLLKCFKNV